MGYEEHTAAVFRKRSRFARVSRVAFILTLVLGVIVSTFPSLSPHGMAAQTPPHETTGAHDMAAPNHMAAMHDEAADEHGMAAAQGSTNHPCGDDSDCGKAMMHCCVQAASAAAIWTTPQILPRAYAQRVAGGHGAYAASHKIDPPTPPPRSQIG